jgi:hypothetical protein
MYPTTLSRVAITVKWSFSQILFRGSMNNEQQRILNHGGSGGKRRTTEAQSAAVICNSPKFFSQRYHSSVSCSTAQLSPVLLISPQCGVPVLAYWPRQPAGHKTAQQPDPQGRSVSH